MKNIKINFRNLFVATLFLGTLASCEDQGYDDYEEEVTPTVAMNGEWWIDITDEATGDVYVQHALHKTFDDNNGRMIVSDRIGSTSTFTGWYLDAPVDVNTGALTFSANEVLNTADESVVTITEGKIMKNAARSATGVVVDSIYFKATFDYDPSTVLIFAGHKRTGFEEDEF